jgi:hypothetical protein
MTKEPVDVYFIKLIKLDSMHDWKEIKYDVAEDYLKSLVKYCIEKLEAMINEIEINTTYTTYFVVNQIDKYKVDIYVNSIIDIEKNNGNNKVYLGSKLETDTKVYKKAKLGK